MHFTIYSPSRTGSHLIAKNIQNKLNATVVQLYRYEDKLDDSQSSNSICIRNRRRDTFSQTLSEVLNYIHNNHNRYTYQILKPQNLDITLFRNLYIKNLKFFKDIDTSIFQKTVDIYFEDVISDPYYLFNQLGYNIVTDYSLCQKSPYDYNSIVTNIPELKKIANRIDLLHKNNIKY